MSDGQFSSKPMRSGQKAGLAAGPPSGLVAPDQVRAFLESRAVRREVNALLDETSVAHDRYECAPFPRRMPDAAEEMGQPIASAVLVQEYLIGLIFLRVAGWLFLGVGAVLIVMAPISFLEAIRNQNQEGRPILWAVPMVAGIGLAVSAAGAWFGYFRGRVITERCWLCTHGVVWMTHGVFDCYSWTDVPEVYCNAHAPRPAIGIRFDRNLSWISFANTLAARHMVQDIENRASALRLPAVLRLLAEGTTIPFGESQMNRQWLANGRDRFGWNQVAEVHVEDRSLTLRGPDNRDWVAIPLHEIPFPSLFTTLARALVAHRRERPSL